MRLRVAACLATVAAATLPPVVVSGATGRVGSAVVRSLMSRRGSAEGVYVLARDAEKAHAMHEGVRCLCAAYDDAEALAEAFGSVPSGFRLFVACSNSPQQAALEGGLCRAAHSAGCAYAVKLSTARQVLEMKQGGPYVAHLEVEALLAELGLPHAVLRPNLFMDEVTMGGFLGVAGPLREADECSHPFALSPISMIDVRDVADCAAALLDGAQTGRGTGGEKFDLTGPDAIALGVELADCISELRPRPVSITACDADAFVAQRGLPPAALASLSGFLGVLGSHCADVTDAVRQITGRPARSLRDFVRDRSAVFLPSSFERLLGAPAPSFAAAARVATASTADDLEELAADEVLIRVMVAGVNGGADTFSVTRAAADATEIKLGAEGVGVVVAAGAEADYAAGDRVAFIGGGYSEYTRAKARLCNAVDEGGDAAEQTAARISGLTAAVALGHTAPVRPGDVVVVTACCGATGSFAVQLAKAAGASVVGTVGSAAKVDAARRLGADRVLNYRHESLADVLATEYPGGVDVAYEGVGGALLGAVCANLKPEGRVLVVGAISQYPHNDEAPHHGVEGVGDIMDDVFRPGRTVELPNGGRLIGNVWGDAFRTGVLPAFRDRLYADLAAGEIRALVDGTRFCGVREAPAAVAHMLAGRNTGKTVLHVSEH